MKSALKIIFGDNVTSPREGGSALQSADSDTAYYTRYSGKQGNKSDTTQQPQTVAQGTNLLDKYGRRTKCAICQSTYHWAKDCPNKKEHVRLTKDEGLKDEVEECNITLFSNESLSNRNLHGGGFRISGD